MLLQPGYIAVISFYQNITAGMAFLKIAKLNMIILSTTEIRITFTKDVLLKKDQIHFDPDVPYVVMTKMITVMH